MGVFISTLIIFAIACKQIQKGRDLRDIFRHRILFMEAIQIWKRCTPSMESNCRTDRASTTLECTDGKVPSFWTVNCENIANKIRKCKLLQFLRILNQ
jgi:hypothetical protein